MSIFQAIILGVVQGITEFFPVSSSGHLVLLQNFFGIQGPQIAFDVFLHLGTLLAIIIYFWKDILALFGKDRKKLLFIAWASVPTAMIGLALKNSVEGLFANVTATAFMLLVTGLWLMLASFYEEGRKEKTLRKKMGPANAFIVGVAQGIAVIPGISRSGATIATGMLSGLAKETAFSFSFLLAIPAVLGATALKAVNIKDALASGNAASFLVGAGTATLVGLGAIFVLSRVVRSNRLYIFGVYCLVVGIAVAIISK